MAKDTSNKFQVWAYSKTMALDAAIHQAAQAERFGSGMGFGERDISFFADSEADAFAMKDRILKIRGVTKVEVVYPAGYITFKNKKTPKKGKWKAYETLAR